MPDAKKCQNFMKFRVAYIKMQYFLILAALPGAERREGAQPPWAGGKIRVQELKGLVLYGGSPMHALPLYHVDACGGNVARQGDAYMSCM